MSTATTVKKTRGRPAKAKGAASRPTRIPLSGSRKRMHVDPDLFPGYHIAWINDQKDLVFRAKRALYENVTVDEIPGWGSADVDAADSASSLVSMKVDNDTTAYLMKLPMEYWNADQAEKRALNEARTADMKKDLNSGKEGTYGEVDIS
jgi:hypothetical protein